MNEKPSGKLSQIRPQSLQAVSTRVAMEVNADGRVTEETPTTWNKNRSGSWVRLESQDHLTQRRRMVVAVGADGNVAEEVATPIEQNFSGHVPRLESRAIHAASSDGLTAEMTAARTDDTASVDWIRLKPQSHVAGIRTTMVKVSDDFTVEPRAATTDENTSENLLRLRLRLPHTRRTRLTTAAGANGFTAEKAETLIRGVSDDSWRKPHYYHSFAFDARGSVRKQEQTSILFREHWRLETDSNPFESHSLLEEFSTSHSLRMCQWSYALYLVSIGLASLILSLVLLCCWSDTAVIWLTDFRLNRKARRALLEHRKGDDRPSWQLFRNSTVHGPFFLPQLTQAIKLSENTDTMNRIGMVFDALKSGGQYVTKNAFRRLCVALEAEITFGDTNEQMTWLSASEEDHNWLFECWDEAFPNHTHLDRTSFSDLLKLLVAWRIGRSKVFHFVTRHFRLLSFPKLHVRREKAVFRVNLGAPFEPIVIWNREVSESTTSEGGSVAFRHEVEEREFLTDRSSRGVLLSNGESSKSPSRGHY